MIHPTRTNLLMLKDRARTVEESIAILKGRRQALIREFLQAGIPLLRSRREISRSYARALRELHLSVGHEGSLFMESLAPVNHMDLGLKIVPGNVMGLRYRQLSLQQTPLRSPEERGYDFTHTTPHLEEALHLFETIVADMLELAAFETRLKRLAEELQRVTRRIRVLEERTRPALHRQIRAIGQYLGEREREEHFRLKRFKQKRLEDTPPSCHERGPSQPLR